MRFGEVRGKRPAPTISSSSALSLHGGRIEAGIRGCLASSGPRQKGRAVEQGHQPLNSGLRWLKSCVLW